MCWLKQNQKVKTTMNNLRTVHANDPRESLNLPPNPNAAVFKAESWIFDEAVPHNRHGALMKLTARCKVPGFEKYRYEWYASEADIRDYGGGDEKKWVEYVKHSFYLVLSYKEAEAINAMFKDLNMSRKLRNARNPQA